MVAEKVTSNHIRNALREYYKQPEYAIAFEVGDATGHRCKRHADAVVMGMYPSSGLPIIGIEIKVSKSDYKAEIENPEKADAVARFCDQWYIAAPTGMIDVNSLPIPWGLLEYTKNETLRVKKWPVKFEDVKPLSRTFAAALFRGMQKEDMWQLDEAVRKRTESLTTEIKREAELRIRDKENRFVRLQDSINKIKATTGIDLWKIEYMTDTVIAAIKDALNYTKPTAHYVRRIIQECEVFIEKLKRTEEYSEQTT